MRLAAVKPDVDINDVFKLSDNALTGYDASSIDGLVGFDLANLTVKPTSILSGALVGFT